MTITKCDVCRKQIRKDAPHFLLIATRRNPELFIAKDVCLACSAPFTGFLKRNGLLEKRRSARARDLIRTNCSICRKALQENEVTFSLTRYGEPFIFLSNTICSACGGPITVFVRKHKLDQDRSGHPLVENAAMLKRAS